MMEEKKHKEGEKNGIHFDLCEEITIFIHLQVFWNCFTSVS